MVWKMTNCIKSELKSEFPCLDRLLGSGHCDNISVDHAEIRQKRIYENKYSTQARWHISK